MKRFAIMSGLALCLVLDQALAASPLGVWKTIDDETGQPKSLVQITENNGLLQARIVKLFRKPDEDQNPLCVKCDGERKNQPVIGMTILWGLRADGEKYSGGHVLDPKKGKIYNASLKVASDGKQLEMRGFLGFSLLGRTQVWLRETP